MNRTALYIVIVSICYGCAVDNNLVPHEVLEVPDSLPVLPEFAPAHTPDKAKIRLGKKLFYDPIVSGNNKVSCATCHLPHLAFSDGVSLGDMGVSGKTLPRNSPSLINLAWQNTFFWDGGSTSLESQVLGPILAQDEMDQDLNELFEELESKEAYRALFQEAFGTSQVTTASLIQSIAQFERTLISGNSKYDQVEVFNTANFTDQELKGKQLFETTCSQCHPAPLFHDNAYHNNGLDSSFPYVGEDERLGRNRLTGDAEDLGVYKTPTLRNIEVTGPYMHDGRFANLNQVLEHYETAHEKPGVDIQLDSKINFNETEKEQLISFLMTLTDDQFLNNTNFTE